jgi:hypothetical protein
MRLVVATTDPAALPERSTCYLATDFARPDLPTPPDPPRPAATLAEVVGLYGLRLWCEQDLTRPNWLLCQRRFRFPTALRSRPLFACASDEEIDAVSGG